MEGRTGLLNSEENTYKIVRIATVFFLFYVLCFVFVCICLFLSAFLSACNMSFFFLFFLFFLFFFLFFLLFCFN